MKSGRSSSLTEMKAIDMHVECPWTRRRRSLFPNQCGSIPHCESFSPDAGILSLAK